MFQRLRNGSFDFARFGYTIAVAAVRFAIELVIGLRRDIGAEMNPNPTPATIRKRNWLRTSCVADQISTNPAARSAAPTIAAN